MKIETNPEGDGIRIYPTKEGWEKLKTISKEHYLVHNFKDHINTEEDSWDFSTYKIIEKYMPEYIEKNNSLIRKPSIRIDSPIQKICKERGITVEQWHRNMFASMANLVFNDGD